MQTEGQHRFARAAFALATALVCAAPLIAQQPSTAGAAVGATVRLSLDDALRLAEAQSQNIEVARSNVVRATGQRYQARSQFFPQLNATAAYGKTLESQFSSFSAAAPVDTTPKPQAICAPNIPANATPDQRLAALSQASTCQSSSSALGFDLSKTSFGAKNQWTVGLNFSQNVYTGGRISAQADAANAQLTSANIEVNAQRAQSALDVTSAYYDAALADQLVAIADSSVAQTEVVLAQTRVARQVGNAAEYDLLRAQVTRDNQLPAAIQARSNRQVAYLRLKQLLNMPLDNVVQLTTQIETPQGPNLPSIASTVVDTSVSGRAPVRELDEAVRASEAQVRVARSERIPSLAIVSAFQRLYFPQQLFPSSNFGVNNWTIGVQTAFPILDGGRIKGDQMIAEAGVKQARAQREQTRQFAALDTRVALNQLEEAQATWEASKGTADQAQRTYAIDEVRFREGISTQTDLTQSRLLLEQSRANRAMAARNLAVARVRLALIHDLPIQQTGTGAVSAQNATAQQQQQQLNQSQQQTNSANQAARPTGGAGGTGGSIQP
jgi:outer membrane protein TolC